MPPTVPLETFVLTLHVPRTISDTAVTSILTLLRRKSFQKRLQEILTEFLRPMPAFAPVTVSITP
jgi:hypothetical protein